MSLLRSFLLLVVVVVLSLVPTRSLAQPVPGQLAGIVANGTGSASEPAQSATLQFLVGSSLYYGMGPPMMESVEAAPGTPVAGWSPAVTGTPGAVGLTHEQLLPIVETLIGAGVAQEAITVTVPAASGIVGPGGPDAGEIRVVVDQPEGDMLVELVSTVRDSARGAGFEMLHIGARYDAADCAALIQQARDAAVADARARAAGLASSLGVSLGELVQATELTYYGSPEGGSCMPEGSEAYYGPYGPGSYAAFDARSTEARVTVQVTLTFAFGTAP